MMIRGHLTLTCLFESFSSPRRITALLMSLIKLTGFESSRASNDVEKIS